MYGATVANLNVYMKQVGKPESLVWSLNSSQVYLIFPYLSTRKFSFSEIITSSLYWVCFTVLCHWVLKLTFFYYRAMYGKKQK